MKEVTFYSFIFGVRIRHLQLPIVHAGLSSAYSNPVLGNFTLLPLTGVLAMY